MGTSFCICTKLVDDTKVIRCNGTVLIEIHLDSIHNAYCLSCSFLTPIKDEMSCSRTQHRTPGEIRTRDLAIKSPTLYQLS